MPTTRKYSSRSQQTTLTSAVTSGALVLPVAAATTLLAGTNINAGETFTVVIDPDTALEEIVDITSASSNNLTVTRAVDGSSAQDHSAGAVVRHMIIGRDPREANTHAVSSTGVHGLASTSSVVGTLDTQTLTNKTLTSPAITDPTITGTASAGAVLVFEGATADAYETTLTVVDPTQDNTVTIPNTSGNIVLDTATQTLTNKTLTSPIISGSPTITGLSSAGMSDSSATPKNYVDSILGSATAASTSATSAAASATAAATSATSAAASATAAATSASSASTSQSAAATSATSAAASATAAATSATSAAASATAAASSATTAANSVATIASYASAAATSASSAATSASSAATSASSAAAYTSAAATSASSAATSASSAAASASAAATSASSAATSASSAATSASSAAAAMANAVDKTTFDAKGDLLVGTGNDTYTKLGVGTNGYILTAASTTTSGLAWSAAPAGYTAPTLGTTTITSGTTVSTVTSLTLSNATLSGTLTAGGGTGTNGQLLTSTGTGVQWAAAPVSLPTQTGNGGKLLTTDGTTASWAGAAPVAQISEPTTLIDGLIWVDTDGTIVGQQITRWSKTLSTSTTTLSGNDDASLPLSYVVGNEMVYLNGVMLSRGNDYTATDGTTITLTTAGVSGDIVEIVASAPVAVADVYTQTQTDTKYIPKTLTTTTGDIIYASSANTPARLGIGSSGQYLTVSGGVPAWGTISTGGMTLITETTASALSSLSFTGLGSYKHLWLTWDGIYTANAGDEFSVRLNNDSGTNYTYNSMGLANSTGAGNRGDMDNMGSNWAAFAVRCSDSTMYRCSRGEILIENYSSTSKYKRYTVKMSTYQVSYNEYDFQLINGIYKSTSAITSVDIYRSLGSGTFTNVANTSIRLYGIS